MLLIESGVLLVASCIETDIHCIGSKGRLKLDIVR